MTEITAALVMRAWRKVDLKLAVDGQLHVLRWRRRTFHDEVLFDDRRVATASGVFGRETMFGLGVAMPDGEDLRLLLTIDPAPDWSDWSGNVRPSGVRLESADKALVAIGSLGPDRAEPFRTMFDRAVKSLGLS